MSIEQIFTFLAFLFPTVLGLLNWYDKRKPRMSLTPVEDSDVAFTLNKAIALANKRALDAEERASKLENLYETMKTDFDVWMSNQSYRLVFDVTLGKNPRIENNEIIYTSNQKDIKTSPKQ